MKISKKVISIITSIIVLATGIYVYLENKYDLTIYNYKSTYNIFRYQFIVLLITLLGYLIYEFINKKRINAKLYMIKNDKKIKRKWYDLFYTNIFVYALVVILIVIALYPSFKHIEKYDKATIEYQDKLNKAIKKIEEESVGNDYTEQWENILKTRSVVDLLGFDDGVVLNYRNNKFEMYLYNSIIETEDDLNIKRVIMNNQNEIIYDYTVKLDKSYIGYQLSFVFTDASNDKYLLGIASKREGKKLYSNLFAMKKDDKDFNMKILQSYEYDIDPEKGIEPQNDIPTGIVFTLEIAGDYIMYADVDSVWKVQNIETQEVYSSGIGTEKLEYTDIVATEVNDDIVLLYFNDTNEYLTFNEINKKFSLAKSVTKENDEIHYNPTIELSEEERDIYYKFSNSPLDYLLNGLSPLQVFKIYIHAEENENYEMLWHLLDKKSNNVPAKEDFIKPDFHDEVSKNDIKKYINNIKNNSDYIKEEYLNNGYTVILKVHLKNINDKEDRYFRLQKNQNGVWKIGWYGK